MTLFSLAITDTGHGFMTLDYAATENCAAHSFPSLVLGSQGLSESDLLVNQAKSFLFVRFVFSEQQDDETHCAFTKFQQ